MYVYIVEYLKNDILFILIFINKIYLYIYTMPFSTSTKKMNMVLSVNARPTYYSNIQIESVGSGATVGVLNGIGSIGGSRRAFGQGSMIDKISNIKNSGCSSCGK
jgi:hypothetical protein